jgi:hypothetical protein
MEREEKEAFWLITSMLSEQVLPSSVKLLNEEDKRQVLYLTKLASNYISEGRLIPKNILDFVKSKVIIADLREYIKELLIYDLYKINPRKTDVIIINLLLKEIQEQETVDIEKEEKVLLRPSDIKYLEKLIFGKAKQRNLIYEGCPTCNN